MSSFKSKQRAKHGHLFGDDPLNAALVSGTDDPLFSSSSRTTSQSSRTNSPVSNDPLSRPSSSNGPLDFSSSTPLSSTSPRRAYAKANGSLSPSSGSIFGDIDVSKLGTSNGHSKRMSTTSLRSTATLRSSNLEDEEDILFGGKSTTRSRVNSRASPVASIHNKSPIVTHMTLPSKQEESPAVVIPVPRNPTPPPMVVAPKEQSIITKPIEQQEVKIEKKPIEQQEKKAEQKPTVSSSSSFFRFFKSNSTQSKPSSSASSAVSVNAPSSPVINNETTNTATSTPPPPPRQQIIQPQPRIVPKPTAPQQQVEEEEEEEEQLQNHQIFEDEATRAFADDVMTFKPITRPAQYFSPELTMDALRIDTPPNKRLIPSASTPTVTTVDDPWSTLRQPILLNGPIEPSISSPLVIKEQDIEPQKRTAFADLIASWNTGEHQKQQSTTASEDPEQFFSHVAEEKKDVGFAGIQEETEEIEERSHIIVDWAQAEENPWN